MLTVYAGLALLVGTVTFSRFALVLVVKRSAVFKAVTAESSNENAGVYSVSSGLSAAVTKDASEGISALYVVTVWENPGRRKIDPNAGHDVSVKSAR